ncbi:MAG: hypothetical protein ACTS6G_04695 [Candidatus Hodgkinia cicadicola]
MKNITAEATTREYDGPEGREHTSFAVQPTFAYALARSSGIDIFERTMNVDGTFKVVRSRHH